MSSQPPRHLSLTKIWGTVRSPDFSERAISFSWSLVRSISSYLTFNESSKVLALTQ